MPLPAALRGMLRPAPCSALLRPAPPHLASTRTVVTHYPGQLNKKHSQKRRMQEQEKKNRVWQHPHPYRVPVKFRVVPPQDPEVKKTYDKRVSSLGAARWSDQSTQHPLAADPVHDRYPQRLSDGAVRYYGFDYYPIDPDNMESIPREEISPLFMLTLQTRFKLIPWFYANILKEFGFKRSRVQLNQVVVCKNTPCNNRKLYNVKHLIEITPIRLPEHLPHDADPNHCFLTDDGEFIYNPEMAISEERMTEAPYITERTFTVRTLHKEGLSRWRHPWEMRQ